MKADVSGDCVDWAGNISYFAVDKSEMLSTAFLEFIEMGLFFLFLHS